uniref:Yippee domain-containing protein n=1 Tax=Cucumis melo TaxID=3656 RepID=A0A9I9CTZ5_CUCME
MGRLFVVNLEGRIYSCKHCRTHLALYEDIVSKTFQSRHGKAYLFNKVVNVSVGVKETRMMMTGMHTVADIFCVGCGSIVGWTYETAFEKNQKYKEGKSVLERFNHIRIPYWPLQKDLVFKFKVSGPGGTSYWAMVEEVMQMKLDDDDDDDDDDIIIPTVYTTHPSNVHILQLIVLQLSFLISASKQLTCLLFCNNTRNISLFVFF